MLYHLAQPMVNILSHILLQIWGAVTMLCHNDQCLTRETHLHTEPNITCSSHRFSIGLYALKDSVLQCSIYLSKQEWILIQTKSVHNVQSWTYYRKKSTTKHFLIRIHFSNMTFMSCTSFNTTIIFSEPKLFTLTFYTLKWWYRVNHIIWLTDFLKNVSCGRRYSSFTRCRR